MRLLKINERDDMFKNFVFDFWAWWGFFAQFLFMMSFAVQWYKSEKLKQSHLPNEFWYLRLAASLMLIVYVVKKQDLVFFIGVIIQSAIYIRNIILIKNGDQANA